MRGVMKLNRPTRRKLTFQISILIFVLLIIGGRNDNRVARAVLDVFLHWDTALYAFWACLALFLGSLVIFLVFRFGKPSLLFYLSLVWLGNYLIVSMLGYEMPIHLLVIFPVAFFSSIYFLLEYCEHIAQQLK